MLIDPCARAEVLANTVMDTLEGQKKAATVFDEYDMAAHSIMTTMSLYGGSTQTARIIAADLREFVKQKISASSSLLLTSPVPGSGEGEPPPDGPTVGRGTGL